jgi:hypothetical protein
MTTASLASPDHSSAVLLRPGTGFPCFRPCLSQLYRVASEIPSSVATATTVRFCGGRSFLRIADLRSSEYRAIEILKPPTRDEFRRKRQLDNDGDMVGYSR